jgi:hypothetical protein
VGPEGGARQGAALAFAAESILQRALTYSRKEIPLQPICSWLLRACIMWLAG